MRFQDASSVQTINHSRWRPRPSYPKLQLNGNPKQLNMADQLYKSKLINTSTSTRVNFNVNTFFSPNFVHKI